MTRIRMKRNQNNGEDTNSPGRTGRGWVKKLTLRILDIRHDEKQFHSFTLYARKCCHSRRSVGRSYERSNKKVD